jgi:hypothetical protein
MGLIVGALEQPPVDLGEAAEELTDLEVVARHGADQRDQFLADVFGDGLLVDFDREVVAALGRIFMERALEEAEGGVDLALQLFLPEAEEFVLFAHQYAYIYAYFRASKPACQEVNGEINAKNRPKELNCYHSCPDHKGVGSYILQLTRVGAYFRVW